MKNIYLLLTESEKKLCKTYELDKNEILFHEEDVCHGICIILQGNISISSFSYEGNEIVYNQLTTGQIFGNNLLFSNQPIYKGNVIAKTKSVIAYIEKQNLIKILQGNKEFLFSYLEAQSEFAKSLNSKIKLLSFESAKERFLYYLYINGNNIKFGSVTSLANELSMKRETLSRLISSLVKNGVITRNLNNISKK